MMKEDKLKLIGRMDENINILYTTFVNEIKQFKNKFKLTKKKNEKDEYNKELTRIVKNFKYMKYFVDITKNMKIEYIDSILIPNPDTNTKTELKYNPISIIIKRVFYYYNIFNSILKL